MIHALVPRARGIVSALLRFVSLPTSLALGGLLLAAPAAAQETGGARATLVDVVVEEGALKAYIQWPEAARLPSAARLISYDGSEAPSAVVDVTPVANQLSVVALPSEALQAPWDTGWSQKLVLEDGSGEVLASLPYDVSLDCDGQEGDERCELVVSPGPATLKEIIHLSDDLDQAIAEVTPPEGEELDLVARVSEAYPELRGEAMLFADRVARARPQGPCQCNWAAVIQRDPVSAQSRYRKGHLSELFGDNGAGAAHWLHAKAYGKVLSNVHEISEQVSGASQVTLKLSCSQLLYIIDKWVQIFRPDGTSEIVHIYQPVYGSCTAPCAATFHHLGRYTGQTTVNASQKPAHRAIATESGSYSVDGVPLINQSTAAGGGFDNTSGMTVSGYSSTGRIAATGYARAVGRWKSADASVRNGYALAIHGSAACGVFPNEAAVWDYGTTQGLGHQNSLKTSISSFFWQWNIPVNP